MTVLVSSHLLSEVELMCDRATIINRGSWSLTARWPSSSGMPGSTVSYVVDRGRRGGGTGRPASLAGLGLTVEPGGGGSLAVSGAISDGSQISCVLAADGIYVSALGQEKPDLERVFLSLTEGQAGVSVRAELAKVRSMPTPFWCLLAVVVCALLGVAAIWQWGLGADLAGDRLALGFPLAIASIVFGVWIFGVEYGQNTLRRTLSADPAPPAALLLQARSSPCCWSRLVTVLIHLRLLPLLRHRRRPPRRDGRGRANTGTSFSQPGLEPRLRDRRRFAGADHGQHGRRGDRGPGLRLHHRHRARRRSRRSVTSVSDSRWPTW